MLRFFAGLASGLLIAYLTAPGPGKKTRTTLVDSTRQNVEKVRQIKEQWDKTVTQVKELLIVVQANATLSLPNLVFNGPTGRLGTTKMPGKGGNSPTVES